MRDIGGSCLRQGADVGRYVFMIHVNPSGEDTAIIVAQQCLKQDKVSKMKDERVARTSTRRFSALLDGDSS